MERSHATKKTNMIIYEPYPRVLCHHACLALCLDSTVPLDQAWLLCVCTWQSVCLSMCCLHWPHQLILHTAPPFFPLFTLSIGTSTVWPVGGGWITISNTPPPSSVSYVFGSSGSLGRLLWSLCNSDRLRKLSLCLAAWYTVECAHTHTHTQTLQVYLLQLLEWEIQFEPK